MRSIIIIFLILFCSVNCFAQQPITVLDSGHKTSLRGLSVVDDNTIWASGSAGTVARSVNGGKTFEWLTVKGYEKRDFRDIEAFDANTAIIMGVDAPAIILKTKDGGQTWKLVFKDTTKGMFLDAMDFRNSRHGVVIGDPVTDKPFLAYTENGGDSWIVPGEDKKKMIPALYKDEAFFASSGTNIRDVTTDSVGLGTYVYVSGGTRSNLYVLGVRKDSLPLVQGENSTGANSIVMNEYISGGADAVVVGGDFAHDTARKGNCVLLNFKFKPPFIIPNTPPHGYRSCVEYIAENKLITCGTSGIDISMDGGMNWKLISRQSFHVCQRAKKGTAVFLAGANGKIGRLAL